MSDVGILLPTAQIAVVFAGFASLVGLLGRRNRRDDPRLDAYRMRMMLETAILAFIFSLLPLVPIRLGFSDVLTWRLSSGVFAFLLTTEIVVVLSRLRPLVTNGIAPNVWWSLLTLLLALAAVVPLWLNTLDLFPAHRAGLYVSGVCTTLVVVAVLLLRVVGSVLVQPDS